MYGGDKTKGSLRIPGRMVRNVVRMRGAEGEEWLRRLPGLVSSLRELWGLDNVGQPFAGIWYNWVAPVWCADGTPAVLKLCVPGDEEFASGALALEAFDGRGAVRLLELDLGLGAMLMERVEPGEQLYNVRDEEAATLAAADVIRKLHRPVPPDHSFPTVSRWARGFDRLRDRFGGGTGPMPEALVERAESLFAELLSSQEEQVLLHGDLHQENILYSSSREGDSWLAIDPKGVVGDPAYETAAMLHNPDWLLKEPRPGEVLERRVYQLSEELDLDLRRVWGWGFAQAVLAAFWVLEDSAEVWDQALRCAELLATVES